MEEFLFQYKYLNVIHQGPMPQLLPIQQFEDLHQDLEDYDDAKNQSK